VTPKGSPYIACAPVGLSLQPLVTDQQAGCERLILAALAARGVAPNVVHEVSAAGLNPRGTPSPAVRAFLDEAAKTAARPGRSTFPVPCHRRVRFEAPPAQCPG
jgi:hypothetical protein